MRPIKKELSEIKKELRGRIVVQFSGNEKQTEFNETEKVLLKQNEVDDNSCKKKVSSVLIYYI